MDNIFFILTLAFIAASGLCSVVRQYQMLQQNSYYISRYLKWVFPFYRTRLIFDIIFAAGASALLWFKLYIPAFILAVIIFAFRLNTAIKMQKKSVKALALTARVKRLFVTAFLVSAGLVVLGAFVKYTFFATVFVAMLSPVLTLICRILNSPIEALVNAWYINDAKRIIKAHKDLIVIGVTGSYGKTTTKFILTRILSEKFNVMCTPHSFNTPMGVVRTVRERLTPPTEIFIAEMGAK